MIFLLNFGMNQKQNWTLFQIRKRFPFWITDHYLKITWIQCLINGYNEDEFKVTLPNSIFKVMNQKDLKKEMNQKDFKKKRWIKKIKTKRW